MKKTDKIYIAGHTGLVGSALLNRLQKDGYVNILVKSHTELDLIDELAVKKFFKKERPDYIFFCVGKVGGIVANKNYPADFIYQNLRMTSNVIHYSYESRVKKLLYLGCACIYPRDCSQPIKEEYFLTGQFEPTNSAYSVAKLVGLEMCKSYNKQYNTNFISCIYSNIFGPNDNFDPESGHVIPGLIRKFHLAKINNEPSITIWGSGKPRRDFIYVDDVVDSCIFLIDKYSSSEFINVSIGNDISIKELSELIKQVIGYKGKVLFDISKPDGMPKKLLDNRKILHLGWKPKFDIKTGLEKTYNWYIKKLK